LRDGWGDIEAAEEIRKRNGYRKKRERPQRPTPARGSYFIIHF
jgi:hypothetical protein